ncbi:MAG: HlyD family efflux transporter periplasmic adaptor subunit [Planctomicrobium sp.]|jgi:HlyD family secretion protein|nr:HlyD family efflux transporter periplasmic adaptor subunit [Planctomicrobium sp.]
MSDSYEKNSLRRGSVTKCVLILLVCAGIFLPVASLAITEQLPVVPSDGFTIVSRGSLEQVLSQTGEIESADNDILISKCEWSTRILSIIPEGSWVEAGEIVAELDSSDIRKRFQERAVLLVKAQSKLADAEEDLQIQKLTNQSILAAAQLQKRLTRLQLDGYLEAEYPQKLHSLEASVALAEEDLARAEKKLEFVADMVQLGYRSVSDRENERINVLKKEQAYELAEDKLKVLRDFTFTRTRTQLKAIADEAERELERVDLASRSSILRREISVRSRTRSRDIYQAYQDRLEENIAACIIRASKSGEVIYAKVSSSSSARIDEGSSMRYLQQIAKIPDRDHLQVNVRIHESNIRLIQIGQPVLINVDAKGLDQYEARVKQISRVPMAGKYPNYHLREYRVIIDVEADPELARTIAPGMTATTNIIAAQRSAAVYVPLHSVVEVGDEHLTFIKKGDEVEPRVVTVGISTDASIEILSGLNDGEEIVLKPRVTCAQHIVALQKSSQSKHDQNSWISMIH